MYSFVNYLIFNVSYFFLIFDSLLKYCTYESTMGKGVDTTITPEKSLQEKEKQAMEKMKVRYIYIGLIVQI